jgi:HK97 family phage prohead protease
MKTKDFSLQVKDLSEDGTFEGYASTFGNVDLGGDVVEPGAYIESLVKAKKEGRTIPMLWQHDQREPIGVWDDLAEDAKGLYVRGRLILDGDPVAQRAYGKLKAKALGGMSIGYRIPPGGEEPDEKRRGVTRLTKLDLREISLVTMPMNIEARVTAVKSERMEEFARRLRDGDPMPIKDFEDILREAGVPKSMAVAIASHGYAKAIRSESEGSKANEPAAFLEALLRS